MKNFDLYSKSHENKKQNTENKYKSIDDDNLLHFKDFIPIHSVNFFKNDLKRK